MSEILNFQDWARHTCQLKFIADFITALMTTVLNLVLSNEKGNWYLKRTINHYYDYTWFTY